MDARQTPGLELQGRYDVVFVRFLNIAMTPDDWAKVAHTAFLMLRPGGSIQWYEADTMSAAIFPIVNDSSLKRRLRNVDWLDAPGRARHRSSDSHPAGGQIRRSRDNSNKHGQEA
jgi:hypothetical protein